MNIHQPERRTDETFIAYQERRRTSNAMVKNDLKPDRVNFMENPKAFFVVQHTTTMERRMRRAQIEQMGARQHKRLMKAMKRDVAK